MFKSPNDLRAFFPLENKKTSSYQKRICKKQKDVANLAKILNVAGSCKMCDVCRQEKNICAYFYHYLTEQVQEGKAVCRICKHINDDRICLTCKSSKSVACFHFQRNDCNVCYNKKQQTKRKKDAKPAQVLYNKRISELRKKIGRLKKQLQVSKLDADQQHEFLLPAERVDFQRLIRRKQKIKVKTDISI
jgi:hypothetical protein